MKKNDGLILGLKFTSMIIGPPIVCIFIALFLMDRFNIGNWVMAVGIVLSVITIIFNMINFAKEAINISKNNDRSSDDDNKRNQS